MATLEVHDGKGRVEYVTIRQDHLALFGSDPKCDIVLADPQAIPFHGRIRCKKGTFKVEAFPEAKSIVLNGAKVIASKLLVGDEIRVGAYRIFLINADDVSVETEKTRVQAAPVAKPGSPAAPLQRGPAARANPQPAGAAADSPEQRLKRANPTPTKPSTPVPRWKRLLRKVWREQAPGEERLAGSPLVLALIVALALLVVLGLGLFNIIATNTAERQFRMAEDSYSTGDYRNAIALYDLFLKSNGRDPRANKVRVMRALANVRQYSVGAGPVWTSALEAAQEMQKSVGKLKEYEDAHIELAEIVLRGAEAITDRAKASAEPKVLAEAKAALTLHTRIAGPPAKSLQDKTNIAKKMVDAEAAVLKGQTRLKALADMDSALKAASAARVYSTRDNLIELYPDLANDRMVVDRLKAGNELLRKAVSFDPTTHSAETVPLSEPLGPPTTLVLRSSSAAKPAAGPQPPVVFAIADGVAYGIDGSDGTPLWQVPVGLASPFQPIPVSGSEPAVLVFDTRTDELVRLKARSGQLLWRLPIGEHIATPPLILGNEAFQAVPSGRLLKIDLISGTFSGALQLNRPLLRAPAADEAGQHLYLAADSAVLYVLTRDPLSCIAVEYLGHDAGSIGCPPARIGRYVIVSENHGINDGRWHVFAIDEETGKVRPVQQLQVPGWTWETPTTAGAVVWSVNDRMGLTAFAIGEVGAKVALNPIAKTIPDTGPSGPAFARGRSEREIIVSGGRTGRFDLNVERQSLTPGWKLSAAGPAVAPVQLADRNMILTQQATEGRGVVVWAVNPTDGSVLWRTVLGAAWPAGLTPSADGGSLTTLGTDGRAISLSRDQLAAGGFIEQPIPPDVDRQIPPGPLQRIESGDLTIVVPSTVADYILVREGSGAFRRVNLPAALGAAPVLWGSDLFAPGGDGRAYLIDPKTGGSKAEPYVPPFDKAKPTRWLAPVKLEDDAVVIADTSGRIRRLIKQTDPRVHLAVSGEAEIRGGLATDPAASGIAVVLATEDGQIRSLAGNDLGALGQWPLESPRSLGPVSSSGHAFVADSAGRVLAFGGEGRRLWTVDMKESPPLGAPVVRDGSALFLGRDGTLHRRSLTDGKALDRNVLGILPSGGPWAIGPDIAVAVGPGSIRIVTGKAETTAKTDSP
jgi:outer membrane protein assembly factor BamB